MIGNSKVLINKITFNVTKKSLPEQVENVINNTTRCYQNIKISQFSHLIKPMLATIKTYLPCLTSITVHKTDFENFDDFIVFMQNVEKSVEEIRLEQVYIKTLTIRKWKDQSHMTFPRLKILEMSCCQASIYHEIFSECKKLTKFSIKSGDQISAFAHRAIVKILNQNVALKSLGIHFNVFNLIFNNEDIATSTKFKLKHFQANDLHRIARGNQHSIQANFKHFLLTQMDSLETFSISNWLGIEVLNLIYHAPLLKKLTMKGLHNCESTIEWNKIELHRNSCIEVLNFSDMSKSYEILCAIINATRNIKELYLYSINDEEFHFITAVCPKIKLIETEKCEKTVTSISQNLVKVVCKNKCL